MRSTALKISCDALGLREEVVCKSKATFSERRRLGRGVDLLENTRLVDEASKP